MLDHLSLLQEYSVGSARVRHVVEGLTLSQLGSRPIPGKWSVLEVVCHLADTEALFAERMKRVLFEVEPALPFADPDRQMTALVYSQRVAAEELDLIEAVRAQMSRILAAQPADAWSRVGHHSREGARTLQQLLEKAVTHLQHHLTFIEEKRRALGVNG